MSPGKINEYIQLKRKAWDIGKGITLILLLSVFDDASIRIKFESSDWYFQSSQFLARSPSSMSWHFI